MSAKKYKVQTWNADGTLKDHYLVDIGTPTELNHLKKFLRKNAAHVVIALEPAHKRPAKK
jgi:hypothetical protein